jgi:uncharacterized protein YndB with AHSA1/START domain
MFWTCCCAMMPVDADTLVVRRLLRVPRERVFAAWLDPTLMARWMCPGDTRTTTVELDPRVGGQFRIVMHQGRGSVEHWGQFLEIERPARLSFTWISVHTERLPSVVTVELVERGAETELVLTHRRLPPGQVEAHRQGWTDIMAKLEETATPDGA